MKGIVVEIKSKDAVLLSDEGNVMKIRNNNYQIGEEIEINSYNKKSKIKFIALVAGFIIAFTTVGGGAYAYTTPYSYVSLDVNPSIEYSVNVFGRVIDATGANKEGELITSDINVENKSIDDAIEDTVSKITEQGYIKDGEVGEIVIATASNNETKAEKLADKLKVHVEKVIGENNLVADVEAFSVGKERVQEAKELGVTPGKLNLVEKLQKSAKSSDDISIKEWLNKPVMEIIKATKVNGEGKKTKREEAINSKKEQNEATNVKEKIEKESKKTNENKSSNIVENKDTNTTSVENKDTNIAPVEKKSSSTPPSGNKPQRVKSNTETNGKKAK